MKIYKLKSVLHTDRKCAVDSQSAMGGGGDRKSFVTMTLHDEHL